MINLFDICSKSFKMSKLEYRELLTRLSSNEIAHIQSNVDFEKLYKECVKQDKCAYLCIAVECVSLYGKLAACLEDKEREEFLLKYGSTQSFNMIVKERFGKKESMEFLEFVEANPDYYPFEFCFTSLIKLMSKKNEASIRNKSKSIILQMCKDCEGKQPLDIEVRHMIALAKILNNSDFEEFKRCSRFCLKAPFSGEPLKRFAASKPDAKLDKLLRSLTESKLPIESIIFIYMNSRLRTRVMLDTLISYLVEAEFTSGLCVKLLRPYSMYGVVKNAKNDGSYLIAADNVCSQKLMLAKRYSSDLSLKEGDRALFELLDYSVDKSTFYIKPIELAK